MSITAALLEKTTPLQDRRDDSYLDRALKFPAERLSMGTAFTLGLAETSALAAIALASSPLYLINDEWFSSVSATTYSSALRSAGNTEQAVSRFFGLAAEPQAPKMSEKKTEEAAKPYQLADFVQDLKALPFRYPNATFAAGIITATAIAIGISYYFGAFSQVSAPKSPAMPSHKTPKVPAKPNSQTTPPQKLAVEQSNSTPPNKLTFNTNAVDTATAQVDKEEALDQNLAKNQSETDHTTRVSDNQWTLKILGSGAGLGLILKATKMVAEFYVGRVMRGLSTGGV